MEVVLAKSGKTHQVWELFLFIVCVFHPSGPWKELMGAPSARHWSHPMGPS